MGRLKAEVGFEMKPAAQLLHRCLCHKGPSLTLLSIHPDPSFLCLKPSTRVPPHTFPLLLSALESPHI